MQWQPSTLPTHARECEREREMVCAYRSPNPGLNDAGELIVSVTILNYFWALCACACNGTFLPPLFMFSDAKDHFHVY